MSVSMLVAAGPMVWVHITLVIKGDVVGNGTCHSLCSVRATAIHGGVLIVAELSTAVD